MGKLLTGRYGELPTAESTAMSLTECAQRLGMKPSDFVSEEEPKFFRKAFGVAGRYLVFVPEEKELVKMPVWKRGFYLLPIDAADVLRVSQQGVAASGAPNLPVQLESKVAPPENIAKAAHRWALEAQPRFFKCGCTFLELKLQAPWSFRSKWKATLRCPRRCQPALTTLLRVETSL